MTFALNTETHALLVAMDIVGFSRNLQNEQGLCQDRSNLLSAIKSTALLPRALDDMAVQAQFLGDEVRLAFLRDHVTQTEVVEFVREVNGALDSLPDASATAIRTVVLTGSLTVRKLFDCKYLSGALPLTAQSWAEQVDGGQLAVPWRVAGGKRDLSIAKDAYVVTVGRRVRSAALALVASPSFGKPHFVVAIGNKLLTATTVATRLGAFDALLHLIDNVLGQVHSQSIRPRISIGPGSVLLAIPSNTFKPAALLLTVLEDRLRSAETPVAVAVTTGTLGDVVEPWLSDNFEGSAAIVAARMLSKIGPGELAVAPDILQFWSEAKDFEPRELSGKREESFLARVKVRWSGQNVDTAADIPRIDGSPGPDGLEPSRTDVPKASAEPVSVPQAVVVAEDFRATLTGLVATNYLKPHNDASQATEEKQLLYSRVLESIGEVRIPGLSPSPNVVSAVSDWVVSQKANTQLRISGAAGTGKTTLLAMLYWRLLAESRSRENLFVHYIDVHHFSEVVYERGQPYWQQALALCREHLEPIRQLLDQAPDTTLILIIDGLGPTEQGGYSASIRDLIREYVGRAKHHHFIGMRSEVSVLDGAEAALESEPSASIVLRRMSAQDKRLLAFVGAFLRFKNYSIGAKALVSAIRDSKLRDVDAFTLRTLARAHDPSQATADVQSFTDAMAAYCRAFLQPQGADGLERAARLAFELEILESDIPPERIRGSKEWQLLHTHPIVKWFLIAYHVMETFARWGRMLVAGEAVDRATGPQQFPYPYEVNRFCRELLNVEERKPAVLHTCAYLLEEGELADRIHAAYLLGRVDGRNERSRAAQLLQQLHLQLESGDLLKRVRSEPTDSPSRQQYVLLRRTVAISLTHLADDRSPHLDTYLATLLRHPEWDLVNRGFHLEYYGDLPYRPGTAFVHNDTLGSCERTLEQLEERLALGFQANKLFELELHTACALLQHRLAAGKGNKEERTARLRALVDTHADNVQNEELRAYLSMLADHVRSPGTGQGRLIEQLYSMKSLRRAGWIQRGLDRAQESSIVESVADHSFGAYLLGAFFLPEASDEDGYDKTRILRLILMHDLGEAIVGDLVPSQRTQETIERERQAMLYFSMAGTYPQMGETASLIRQWYEFESPTDLNGTIARDLDRLDMLVQTFLYERAGQNPKGGAGDWKALRVSLAKELRTRDGKRLASLILSHFTPTIRSGDAVKVAKVPTEPTPHSSDR